jgi:predicted transcriptional regulator
MSIHPEYAAAIVAGTKKVEFRKRPISEEVTHVVVYATAPVSAVVGAFTVTGQDTYPPHQLWRLFKTVAGISRPKFFAYYSEREHGTGIGVGEVLIPEAPLSLQDDLGVARPPQSYQYLADHTAASLLGGMSTVS